MKQCMQILSDKNFCKISDYPHVNTIIAINFVLKVLERLWCELLFLTDNLA